MLSPIFTADIIDGKIKFESEQRRNFDLYLKSLEGHQVEVVVRKWYKRRSNQENKYYWGVVVKLCAEFFGYDADEMHEALKHKFLFVPAESDTDLARCLSTARLTTKKFEDYTESIRQFMLMEHGFKIPLPNEVEEKTEYVR